MLLKIYFFLILLLSNITYVKSQGFDMKAANAVLQASEKNKLENNEVHEKNYETVVIGNQVWMSDNLNVSHFNDGTTIKIVKSRKEWNDAVLNKEPAYCYLNFNQSYQSEFGKIYNFYAVSSKKLAPKGFHISTHQDWVNLKEYIGDNSKKKLKSKTGWKKIKLPSGFTIPCENCKDWAESYRKKVPCHVCKDTRDSGKRTPIKYASSNGTDDYGFRAKECGSLVNAGFSLRGACFWTTDYPHGYGTIYAGHADFENGEEPGLFRTSEIDFL